MVIVSNSWEYSDLLLLPHPLSKTSSQGLEILSSFYPGALKLIPYTL